MNCPVDGATLEMTERQGVEIDYCPRCRGVWLDRGELDKIIERSETESWAPRYERGDRDDDRVPGLRYDRDREYGREHDDDDFRGYGKRRKKKSFLSEMFEFGD